MSHMEVTHHATLIRSVCPCDYVVNEEAATEQVVVVLEKFGIDDARSLIEQAYQRPRNTASQQLVVQTDFITHEAQNALLKVLEEPPLSTQFLFVLSPEFTLLPTLASRFQQLSVAGGQETYRAFSEFLLLPYGERIAAIDTAIKKKDTAWQRAMKQGLIEFVRAQKSVENLVQLEYVARMLLTRGASNKMLLEHAALVLPIS